MTFKSLLSLFILFFSLSLHAKIYESWHLLYPNTFGLIDQVEDAEKKYKVTEFKSQSSRDTYINGAKQGKRAWNNRTSKIIQWEFKYQESYVIIIHVETLDGDRNLIYTSGDEGGVLYFGLGAKTIDGRWHTIRRDLEVDLERYEPNNAIVAVNAFIIRGSGRMGKVTMVEAVEKEKVKPKPMPPLVKKKESVQETTRVITAKKLKKSKEQKDHMPTVLLKQGALLYHKLGEPFFDPGAIAKDSEGNALEVDVLGEVNINRVNRYVLSYVATDKQGNSTIETRVVMVYKAGKEEERSKRRDQRSLSNPNSPSLLQADGVGGADEFPLPIEEIEALSNNRD